MKTLKIGDKIPKFECLDENEKTFKSIDLIGKKLIIFFYPRANTPGCTAEACNLSENYQTLTDLGYNIVGISCDKPKSQKNFSNKFGFQYPLLADVDKKLVNLFGVWGPKKFMGKEYDGIHRMTFIFNEKGIVQRVIDKVKTKDHTNQILNN
jgi:peroxiredoxin Q/BCP|tara:strand:- start:543 stop:998 length:456 start_codon:yes stop_codon:yes gene_type:complete